MPHLDTALGVVHIVLIPILVGLMGLYVIGSSTSDGQAASSIVNAMLNAVRQ